MAPVCPGGAAWLSRLTLKAWRLNLPLQTSGHVALSVRGGRAGSGIPGCGSGIPGCGAGAERWPWVERSLRPAFLAARAQAGIRTFHS